MSVNQLASDKTTKKDQIDWKSTACMLCSIGCSIEVQVEGQNLKKIRGDKASGSVSYTHLTLPTKA